MKRPDADDYYWYKPTREGDWKDWQPVLVKDGEVWAIGLADATAIDELDGTFVRMGRPVPMLGSIKDLELIPLPIEKTHVTDEIDDRSKPRIRDEWETDEPPTFREADTPVRIKDEWED